MDLSIERYELCPHEDPDEFVCQTPENAQTALRNKAELLRHMQQSRALIDYYQTARPTN
ncbi:hypothetical protein [Aureimonas sp. AU40]|uniref:hypothetical protein n=1 Tax=Aureimonas sp. AU40 TaxID=1637747 RepID=UPI000A71E42D|nr:hypothetical protein [Aureimonas sp. AU40]